MTSTGGATQGTSGKLVSVKVVLLGDASVGKSSLVNRLVQNTFSESLPSTVGAAYQAITMKTDEKDTIVKLEIWDTAGQERYRSLAPMYYRGAQAAVIVFDLTNEASLNSAGVWIDELKTKGDDKMTVAVVGNKFDRTSDITVAQSAAEEFVASQGASFYMECSAKTGHNVFKIFETLANTTIKTMKNDASVVSSNVTASPKSSVPHVTTDQKNSSSNGKCC